MKQIKKIYCESSKDSEKCIFFHKAHNVENMKYGTDSVWLSVRWGVYLSVFATRKASNLFRICFLFEAGP